MKVKYKGDLIAGSKLTHRDKNVPGFSSARAVEDQRGRVGVFKENHPHVQCDLHDCHHHLSRPFPPLASHGGGEQTTTKTPAMAGLRESESLSNTDAQRSLILLP
uniref:Uncharacterized protein n=1 Tax=Populus alba TaxID=43335 RepID=A0A4U5NQ91_POPAL|nr:hypothetical protein D5086_0000252860 [Populus alba]